ncbi:sigma-70 family RNA polymerase sigma factor [Aquihabitans daechungensis]|uniref:sigma-70 family RNA polymerase sigma factor n=1 Tax=Aquihabitans daechungensis TaxID=1052257 RepID=UPI003BA189A8
MTGSRPPGAAADDLDELFRQYGSTGDRSVRNEIVERHRALADGVARRFHGRGLDVDDLRQTALLAMVRAVDRFDPAKGASFATFAGRTMEGELKRSLRDRSWTVRPPRAAQERYLELRRREEELTHRLGRAPTIAELAETMDASLDEVLEAVEAAGARSGVPLTRPDDDGDEVVVESILGRDDGGFDEVEESLLVTGLLDQLDERSRTVLELRYFERLGQEEIAHRLGVSQSYLSRLLRKILADLRSRMELTEDPPEGPTTRP